jgi:hypothetical protein
MNVTMRVVYSANIHRENDAGVWIGMDRYDLCLAHAVDVCRRGFDVESLIVGEREDARDCKVCKTGMMPIKKVSVQAR